MSDPNESSEDDRPALEVDELTEQWSRLVGGVSDEDDDNKSEKLVMTSESLMLQLDTVTCCRNCEKDGGMRGENRCD